MKIKINGAINVIELTSSSLTLSSLLKKLGHDPRLVVVELNGTILTPQTWGEQEIKNGDTLEIVTIVGGGS